MKINKQIAFSTGVLAFLSVASVTQAVLNCTPVSDCIGLGYTMSADECGEGMQVACPTDPSKIFCRKVPSCDGRFGDILYGDGSCSASVLLNKKPVGIVVDPAHRLAVSLTFINKDGSAITDSSDTSNAGMQWAESGSGDIPGLSNCYVGMLNFQGCDTDGQKNTKTIISYDNGKNIHHAALATAKFEPSGCKAAFCKKGKWWLPSLSEVVMIHHDTEAVDKSLYNIRNIVTTSPVNEDTQLYWTSNENKNGLGAFLSKTSLASYMDHGKYEFSPLVRPVVRY